MEQPLLRVSRPVSACSRCRNAKTKCDGKLPACTACERSNRAAECSSANDQFAKGKERSYVASLESKVERLEKQVAQRKQRRSSTTTDINFMRTLASDASTASGRRKSRRKEASEIDELVSDFGFLSVNATSRDFHGFTKEMSFARLILSTSSVDAMPRYSEPALPSRDIARGLIQKCINEVLVLYPVFSDTATFGSFEAVYQHPGYASTPLHWWNTCMVLAIAYISQSHAKDDAMYQKAVRLASSALESAESVIHPGSVAGLQAIILLVIYSLLDPSHFNSWYLIGVASRVMADLGLHQEPAEDLRIKESQLMLRRRVFYCIYTLDRVISIAHFRAFSFSDDSVNVVPPADSSNHLSTFNAPLVFGGKFHGGITDLASQLLRLRQMQSAWYQTIFQSNREALLEPWQNRTASLYEMRRWIENIPVTTPIEAKNLFLSETLSSSILLLRPPSTTTTLCSYGKALLFDYAVEFSKVTLRLCTISQTYNCCSNIDILRTLFSGQAFLDVLQESPTFAFEVTAPQPPLLSANMIAPPVLQRRSFAEHVEEAINTITRLDHILNTLGCRFSFSPAIGNYKNVSDTILQILYARRQCTDMPIIGRANGSALTGDQVRLAVSSIAPYQDTHIIAKGYLP